MEIVPFRIQVEESELEDLRSRLKRTRWPDEIRGEPWDQGTDLSYLRELADYWIDGFDWRAQERRLDRFRQFRARVGDLWIQFIHERGAGPNPMALVVTHGWPGSIVEMLELVPLLTDPASHGGDPADAFDVVAPSLMGFGFSDRPRERGFNTFRIAEAWNELMLGLGYSRFGAQGGDFGAGVSTILGLRHAQNSMGIHLNYIPGSYRPSLGPGAPPLTEEERRFRRDVDEWYAIEGGYAHQQCTRPQTLGYALNDSPIGLAAWIVEKLRGWSDCEGRIERRFSKDEVLTNVMLYWITQTITSSARLYFEGRLAPLHLKDGERVRVPCGIARFPLEAPFPPRSWIERGYDVRRWTEMPRGGHFAAWEEPKLLAEDVRAFFGPLR